MKTYVFTILFEGNSNIILPHLVQYLMDAEAITMNQVPENVRKFRSGKDLSFEVKAEFKASLSSQLDDVNIRYTISDLEMN